MLENSRVPIRVDAISGTLLGGITGRAVEGAAHSVRDRARRRRPGLSRRSRPFAQFLAPGSLNTRQFQTEIAAGFLDTPQVMGLAHDLVNKGYVPLTRDNVALHTRALCYDVGPVGVRCQVPRPNICFSGHQHYSIVQFEARGGSIRQLEMPQGMPGGPTTAAEAEARHVMIDSAETTSSIVEHIQYLLNDMPNPNTPAGHAARARVENSLRVLEDLAQRYRGRVSAWDM